VGARKDLDEGAHKSINGLLSTPAEHALQAIICPKYCKTVRITSPFFLFLDSWFFPAAPLLPE